MFSYIVYSIQILTEIQHSWPIIYFDEKKTGITPENKEKRKEMN